MKIFKNLNLEKGVLELQRAATIKPRKIELFFFYWITTDKLEFTDWSEVQRKFRRNHNFPTEDDNYAPLGITRVKQDRNLASFQRKPKFVFKNFVEPKPKPFIDYEVNKV